MKKILLLTCMLIVSILYTAKAQVSQLEFDALVAFYNSTNGDSWTDNTNWNVTTGTKDDVTSDWYGITVTDGHVTRLSMYNNGLTGSLPFELGDLTYLTGIFLAKNSLTGNIPASIGNLVNLTGLSMSDNLFSGSIPSGIGNITKAYQISFARNSLSGSIPTEIGNLTNVIHLSLHNNDLSGSIPSSIGNLSNLESLTLQDNQLTGSIPNEIGNLTRLTSISISNNSLSGSIPTTIGNLIKLTSFSLYGNNLTGSLPSEIGNLTKLTSLRLSNNQLSGSIPSEIGNLVELEQLFIRNNMFTGSLPSEIGNLVLLSYADIQNNQLSGSIPEEIGNLVNMKYLYLNKNQFSGDAPDQFQSLTKLDILYLCDNQITGIPDLTSSSLTNFRVQNNNLTFGDIEINKSKVGQHYFPQAKIGEEQHLYIATGSNKTISIVTDGDNNTYQWYKNDVAISGATSFSYTITNFQAADEGTYHCIVENTVATYLDLQTEDIVLSSSASPIITKHPETINDHCSNLDITFTVEASYGDTYQWQRKDASSSFWYDISGTIWIGANSNTLTSNTTNVGSLNGDSFRCIVTNPNGSVTSDAALYYKETEAPELEVHSVTLEIDETGNGKVTAADFITSISDNCEIRDTSINKTDFNCSNVGTSTAIYIRVTDHSGNSTSKLTSVYVVDNIAPVLSVQDHTLELDASGNATLQVSDVVTATDDNCEVGTSSLSKTAFDCSNIGTPVTVDVTLSDAFGNETTEQVTITVVDKIKPSLTTNNFTVEIDATGSAVLNVEDVVTTASDNCELADTAVSKTDFDCSNIGTPVTIDVTLTDESGNSVTKQATITVVDNLDPVLSVQNHTLQLDEDGNATLTVQDVVTNASDNCSLADTILSKTDFDCANVGTPVTVNVTLSDESGNETTEQVTITVEDNLDPMVITKDVTLQLDETGNAKLTGGDFLEGSRDNCGIAHAIASQRDFDCSHLDAPVIIDAGVKDIHGNIKTNKVTVTVLDEIAPELSVQNFTLNLDATGNAILKTSDVVTSSIDNCSVADTSLSITAFNCSDIGSPVVVDVILSDKSGNQTTKQATIRVVDNVDPVLSVQNHTLQLDADGSATLSLSDVVTAASDNCSLADTTLSQTEFNCANIGTPVTVDVTLTDASGNSVTEQVTVTIEDKVKPVITSSHTNKTISDEGNCEATLPDYTNTVSATDNCDAGLTFTQSPLAGSTISGLTPVTLTATDDSGNEATVSFNVLVDDNTNPELSVEDITLQLDANGEAMLHASDIVTSATDNCTIADTVLSITTFNCENIENPTSVDVTLSDVAGNSVTKQITVTIEDNVDPVLAVQNATIYVDENGSATLSLEDVVTATSDNCTIADTTLSKTNFDCANIGESVRVDITLTDASGNSVTESASITVLDDIEPVTPVLADVTNECSATITAPTTIDNCAGTITATTDDPLTYDEQGTHTVSWTFADDNGNSIEVEQKVIIDDVTDPTITCRTDTSIVISQGKSDYTVSGTELDPKATDDNCSVVSIVNDFNNESSLKDADLPTGTTTVVWTITDAAGNTSTCSYDVKVSLASGIDDFEAESMGIYPNPAKTFIKMFSKNAEQIETITIFDCTGKMVISKNITDMEETVDISSLNAGIYFVNLKGEHQTKTFKLLKE